MAKGEFIGTLALAEASGRFDAEGVQLKATKSGNDYTITGEKFFVPDAHVANGMAVAVRTGGSGEKGITLLMRADRRQRASPSRSSRPSI